VPVAIKYAGAHLPHVELAALLPPSEGRLAGAHAATHSRTPASVTNLIPSLGARLLADREPRRLIGFLAHHSHKLTSAPNLPFTTAIRVAVLRSGCCQQLRGCFDHALSAHRCVVATISKWGTRARGSISLVPFCHSRAIRKHVPSIRDCPASIGIRVTRPDAGISGSGAEYCTRRSEKQNFRWLRQFPR